MNKAINRLTKLLAALSGAVFFMIFSGACEKNKHNEYLSRDFFAMDTFITVSANTQDSAVLDDVEQEIRRLESIFSATDPTSELSKINESRSTQVSVLCAALLSRSAEISRATDGAFNPCLGLIRMLWDVTGRQYVPTADEIAALLPFCTADSYSVSGQTVTKTCKETVLDLGAAVKGYAAEQAIAILREKGVTDAMINLGGNIAICGSASDGGGGWRIGIRNPFFPDTLAGSFSCTDRVIAVSGDYERYFERDGVRYHHIFDPATGFPADSGLKSTAVIAADGMLADALSTALFVMGKDKALSFYESGTYDFEAILFTSDGQVIVTDGIRESFTLFPDAEYKDGIPLTLVQ